MWKQNCMSFENHKNLKKRIKPTDKLILSPPLSGVVIVPSWNRSLTLLQETLRWNENLFSPRLAFVELVL